MRSITMMEELRLSVGFFRGHRTVVEIGEESPILTEDELTSIERGELEEIE